jgi:spermidine/putrescine transport system substrate-binding protein
MSKKPESTQSSATLRAARAFTRRTLVKASAATGLALSAAPWALRHAKAAGELNVFAWGDYVQAFQDDGIVKAFEEATGTKVNLSTYGSNEECENKLRAAGGKGFDLIFPSVDTGPNYYKDDLLQPVDESRIETGQVITAMYRNSLRLGAAHRGKRYLVPFDWGTEAITWDSEKHPDLAYGNLSYGHLFEGDAKAAMRQKSVLNSVALYLDAAGIEKTDRGMDLYKSEEDCRRVFEAALKFVNEHRKNIGAYWNNATEATAAFTDAGCSIGQTWDTTGILLNRNVAPKWRYSMPKEGGLAWMDTVAIPAGVANPEGAYAFINHLTKPEMGATFANRTGYNSCAKGADAHLNEEAKAAFAMAYPDEAAIDNLWWWPMQTDFYAQLRGEYVEKMTNT